MPLDHTGRRITFYSCAPRVYLKTIDVFKFIECCMKDQDMSLKIYCGIMITKFEDLLRMFNDRLNASCLASIEINDT